MALKVLQNNIRSWGMLRTWPWFLLLGKAKVLAESARDAERLQELMDKAAVRELQGKNIPSTPGTVPGARIEIQR